MNPKFIKLKDFNHSASLCNGDIKQQNELFQTLADFPQARALHVFLLSFVKVLPVGIYTAFTLPYSFYENLTLFYIADVFIIAYASGLLYIQLHSITSEMMAELKDHESWKVNYRELKLRSSKDHFSFVQNSLLVAMLLNLLLLMGFAKSLDRSTYNLIFIFGISLLCIGDLQLKFQKFFKQALTNMFKLFEGNVSVLPLHTSPILAGFEYTFNQMGMKLNQRTLEVSQWLKHETEKSHLRSLGEITALVAHDIRTPLGLMQMSLDKMNCPETTSEERLKYEEILRRNLAQSISFNQSLTAYTKRNSDQNCSLGEIHQHLLKLLETQLTLQEFENIVFKVQDNVHQFLLGINRLNAMHIFFNLYQNAINAGSTEIIIRAQTEAEVDRIFIQDNGIGLKEEDFREFTEDGGHFYKGLGLRLTNTIIGHLNGSLIIVPSDSGTCFQITLPRFIPIP